MDTPAAGLAVGRRRPEVWVAVLLAAALGWAATIQQATSMAGLSRASGGMAAMAPSPTSALVFLPVWVAMMVAMMFPAIAPVVSLVSTVGRKRRESGEKAVSSAVFVAGYLVVWTLFGLAAYLLSLAVPAVGMAAPGIRSDSSVLAGLILIGVGLYEWGPLKGACLRHCRSPLGTFLTLWREGWTGALRMGAIHGAICLGCCWGLMVVLFTVGLMNLVAMALLAAVIFAQKVLPHGELIARGTGVALLGAGLILALTPWL